MLEVEVPVVTKARCERMKAGHDIVNTNTTICAGGEPGKDACQVETVECLVLVLIRWFSMA